MARVVTDYLDNIVKKYPDKIAFVDENRSITFSQLQNEAYHIANKLIEVGLFKKPILVYLDKSVEVIVAFEGITYSGNFYSPLDTNMPEERIVKIINKLNPAAIITTMEHKEEAEELLSEGIILTYEEAQKSPANVEKIRSTTNMVIDADVLYVLFTSGSTGIPKGVIISHKGIIDLSEWIADDLGFNENTIFANQSPFYFSFSVYEIYQTLRNGSTTYIVPQKYFSQPTRLMAYLEERKVNTIIWVPSILTFISTLKALNRPHLTHIKNIFFGAESFQTKHLNRWMDEYPEVRFINLFGPTEVTDTCTWYEINRRLKNEELIPIGKSCTNKDCFLLDEGKLITEADKMGEICMRGSGIAYGYYNDPEHTAEAFIQNPLNSAYKETIYCTGDLGKYNEYGELVFVCRKDFQIKHRGRRIELGEIESAVAVLEGIDECCCLYDNNKLRIVLFYTGDIDGKEINECLKDILPDYMIPSKRVFLESMPHNLNGKIDRQKLKNMLEFAE